MAWRSEGSRRVQAQHRPHRRARYRRSARGKLGAKARNPGGCIGPHALRHLSHLLSSRISGAACPYPDAAALSSVRSRDGPGGIDRGGRERAAHEGVRPAQRMNREIAIWARGIDRDQFNPERRDMKWRRDLGIADDEMVVAFLGRIVMEKGLDVFSDAIHELAGRGLPYRVLIVGEGPARPWFEEQLPDAIFTGQVTGDDLARALASADVLFNP